MIVQQKISINDKNINTIKEKILSFLVDEDFDELIATAEKIKLDNFGKDIKPRGIIEFSNHCESNCCYCSLREENFTINRYRMSTEEVIFTAKRIINSGIKEIVLRSGEDSFYDSDLISYMVYSIKQISEVKVILSLGCRGFDDYKTWKISGADGYILNHNSLLKVKNGSVYSKSEKRLQHLKFLKRLGYQIGIGTIIGLPHQKIDDIVDELFLLYSLGVNIVNIASFTPAPFTPLQEFSYGDNLLTFRSAAIARILLRKADILAIPYLKKGEFFDVNSALKGGSNVHSYLFTPKAYEFNFSSTKLRRGIMDNQIIKRDEFINQF